jgi:hypothetical protein
VSKSLSTCVELAQDVRQKIMFYFLIVVSYTRKFYPISFYIEIRKSFDLDFQTSLLRQLQIQEDSIKNTCFFLTAMGDFILVNYGKLIEIP